MLDFLLVLGQIPGTNFQITFNEIIALVLAGGVWYLRNQLKGLAIREYTAFLNYLKQHYWQHRQLKLPV